MHREGKGKVLKAHPQWLSLAVDDRCPASYRGMRSDSTLGRVETLADYFLFQQNGFEMGLQREWGGKESQGSKSFREGPHVLCTVTGACQGTLWPTTISSYKVLKQEMLPDQVYCWNIIIITYTKWIEYSLDYDKLLEERQLVSLLTSKIEVYITYYA